MSDGSPERGQKRADSQLESRQINIQQKRYYVDINENHRGRFIKIAELGSNYKSRIILTLRAANAIHTAINGLADLIDAPPSNVESKEAVLIKSETITVDSRRFYLDLKENERGRFLRIAQMPQNARQERVHIAIPSCGIKDINEALADYLNKYYDESAELAAENNDSKMRVNAENKTFVFNKGENDRGQYVRISEIKLSSGYRNAITIPFASLELIRNALNEIIEGGKA
ncbi:unnamed protein product [Caenorhabditis bovis]|uniref:Uncharacterized protein n=1 Tax=Caenorhabditis bovis TaxID=2654633 RepID=A0A8S1EZM4_9PELO|nr:unnamed protein product [Caenorhabditis bovis]